MAWAFAAFGIIDSRPLMHAIASSSIRLIVDFDSQNIGNLAWAFATLQSLDEPLMPSISAAALPRIAAFNMQELANTAWAFAVLEYWHDKQLIDSIASQAMKRIVVLWQPFFDCVDVFPLAVDVKRRAQQQVREFVHSCYMEPFYLTPDNRSLQM